MDEGDERAFRTRTRLLVNQPDTARLDLRQRSVNVVDPQRDVVQARPSLVDVLRDRRIGGGRLEELEARRPEWHEMRPDALRRDLLRRIDLEAQSVAIEGERGVEVADGNADVIEYRFHLLLRVTH